MVRNTRHHYEIVISRNGAILRRFPSQRELFSFAEVYRRLLEIMFHAGHANIFENEYLNGRNRVAVYIWTSVDKVCFPRIRIGADLSLNCYLARRYYEDSYLLHILGVDTRDLCTYVRARDEYIASINRSAEWRHQLDEVISDNLMLERKGALYGAQLAP
jgi:hypothetical protein